MVWALDRGPPSPAVRQRAASCSITYCRAFFQWMDAIGIITPLPQIGGTGTTPKYVCVRNLDSSDKTVTINVPISDWVVCVMYFGFIGSPNTHQSLSYLIIPPSLSSTTMSHVGVTYINPAGVNSTSVADIEQCIIKSTTPSISISLKDSMTGWTISNASFWFYWDSPKGDCLHDLHWGYSYPS